MDMKLDCGLMYLIIFMVLVMHFTGHAYVIFMFSIRVSFTKVTCFVAILSSLILVRHNATLALTSNQLPFALDCSCQHHAPHFEAGMLLN